MTPSNRGTIRALAATIATLLFGLVVSGFAYRYAQQQSHDRVVARFSDSADRARAAVERELGADLDKLNDVGAFVVAGDRPPTAAAFSGYVQRSGVFDHFQSLLGVIVIERVPADAMDAFVARQRTIRPDFAVVPLGEVPAGQPHYVVTYYEPGAIDFSLPTGLDVSSIPSVRNEMETRGARGEAGAGAMQNDPVIKQLAGADIRLQQFDFLMGVPVWPGKQHAPGEQPSVWISAPIGRFDEILTRGLEGQPADVGVRLTVNIEGNNFADAVRRASERRNPPGPLDQAAFRRDLEFTTEGIRWSMTAWSSPDPVADAHDTTPTLVLCVGLAATLVVALGVYMRARGRERDRHLVALQAAHDRIAVQRDVLSSVREAVVVLDGAGRIMTANPGWERLRGRDVDAFGDATPDEDRDYLGIMRDVCVGTVDGLATALQSVRDGSEARADVELPLETDGQRWWSAVRITPLQSEPGGVVILHRDVTEQHRSMAELKLRASHDALTGLLNRGALEEEARHRISRVRDEGTLVGALFVDLDDFKLVNDVYGHEAGDVVLSVVAQRIVGATRLSDLVARQGGDEFVVVLEPLSAPEVADQLAARLLDLIEEPIVADDVLLHVKASIGVVVLDGSTDASLAGLLRKADEAMYESKQSGGARYTVSTS